MVKKLKKNYYWFVNYLALKKVIFMSKNLSLGRRVNIGRKCKFLGNVSIGDNSTIVSHAMFHGGNISIGSNVIIASGCTILTINHDISNKCNALPYGTSYIYKNVLVEDNVWIGRNVSLAPGAHIGEGSIIGMNSVVFGEIPKNSIALGNPAKVVKKRDLNHYKFLKENNFFLNDIRGFNYLSKSLSKKIINKLIDISKNKDQIYDFELCKDPKKARKIMYNYAIKKNWFFKNDKNGFYIKKNEAS